MKPSPDFVTAIILLNLGGPDSLRAVRPFLLNLFSDRQIIRLGPPFMQKPLAWLISSLRSKKTENMYSQIGGKSPIFDITRAQADALEEALNRHSENYGASGHIPSDLAGDFKVNGNTVSYNAGKRFFRVYIGMRYWHPLVEDTVKQMRDAGIRKALAVSLYPQYSAATTGSTIKKFKDCADRYHVEYSCVTSWFAHPIYIDSLVEKIEEGMRLFAEKPVVLFSAHSLPQKFVDGGDPYVREIKGTIEAIIKKVDIQWHLSYQSKTGPVKWLEPTTEHTLEELARKGVKNLLVVPISFVSDHIETLYEIDMIYKEIAKGLGMNLKRT